MNKIPAGYRFTFNSCDIRNDNPYTIIKEGLTESQANLLSELSEYIQGGTYLEVRSHVAEWRIKKEHERLYNIVEKHSQVFTPEQLQDMKEDIGIIMDYISENMVGYTYSEDMDMRTLVSYKIENIPEDILLTDVTYEFSKKNKM